MSGLESEMDAALDERDEKRARQQIRAKAMDLLARREYSLQELQQRLLQRDFAPQRVESILAQLVAEGLLSDERFAESFIVSRKRRGQGPVRIRAELRERGISEALIEAWLDMRDPEWKAVLRDVHDKRFAGELPATISERARQQRFYNYRGFTSEQIRSLFRQDADEDFE
jgi:regulatory protein